MSEARQFYQAPGLNAEIYDEHTRQGWGALHDDAKFYLRYAQRVGGPVLELGAGTGRVSWALAEAGFDVVGLELSQTMLQRAEAKASAFPPEVRRRVRWVRADMADFQLEPPFGLIISPFRAFQVLTSPDAQRRSLRCMHRSLRADGYVILDLFDPRLDWCTPEAQTQPPVSSVRHPDSGNSVQIESARMATDPLSQLLTERWCFREIDEHGQALRQDEEFLTLRWTYRQEMRYLLELTGFDVEAQFSDFEESPPAYAKEQLWVARKRMTG